MRAFVFIEGITHYKLCIMQVYEVLIDNIIKYRIKNVYGNNCMYIVSDHAKQIEQLTGKSTLLHRHKVALEALGFIFEQVL